MPEWDICERGLVYGGPPFLVHCTIFLHYRHADGRPRWPHCSCHDHGRRSAHCNCPGAEHQLEVCQSGRHDGGHCLACGADYVDAEEQSLLAHLDGGCARPDRQHPYRHDDHFPLQSKYLRGASDRRISPLPGVHGHGRVARLASVKRRYQCTLIRHRALACRHSEHAMVSVRDFAHLARC